MRLAEHAARMEVMLYMLGLIFWSKNVKWKDIWRDPAVEWKCILGKYLKMEGVVWNEFGLFKAEAGNFLMCW